MPGLHGILQQGAEEQHEEPARLVRRMLCVRFVCSRAALFFRVAGCDQQPDTAVQLVSAGASLLTYMCVLAADNFYGHKLVL